MPDTSHGHFRPGCHGVESQSSASVGTCLHLALLGNLRSILLELRWQAAILSTKAAIKGGKSLGASACQSTSREISPGRIVLSSGCPAFSCLEVFFSMPTCVQAREYAESTVTVSFASERLGQSLQVHLDELWQQGPNRHFRSDGPQGHFLAWARTATTCEPQLTRYLRPNAPRE